MSLVVSKNPGPRQSQTKYNSVITFKVNGAKHNIPTSWADVTYSQYIAILSTTTLLEHINLFTGIGMDILSKAELRNLEKISLALSFMSFAPKFESQPTKMVGPYVLPKDITINTVGQFEDLRGLLKQVPKELTTKEDQLLLSDLYLTACAIYTQKVRDGSYDYNKAIEIKEQLKNYSCVEVMQTGAFFLCRPWNLSQPTTTRYLNILPRLRKLIQDLPGFQKTSDFLHRSLGSQGK